MLADLLGKFRNDGVLCETATDGGAAGAGEVIAIGAGDTFDDPELAQAGQVSSEGGGRALGEEWQEVGAAEAGDVVGGAVCSGWLKKLRPLTVRPLTR